MDLKDSLRRAGPALPWIAAAGALAVLAADARPMLALWSAGGAGGRGDAAVWASQAVVNWALVLAGWMSVRRRLTLPALLCCLAAGELLFSEEVLIGTLHGFLSRADLYPAMVAHPQTGFVNPQYGMMAAAVAVGAALALRVSVRRWRTFDRAAVAVACLSVAATATLFHVHVLSGVSAMRLAEERLALAVTDLPAPAWPEACPSLRMRCVEFRDGAAPAVSGLPEIDGRARFVAEHALSLPPGSDRFEFSWHGAASAGPHGVSGFAAAARLRGDAVRVAYSQDRPSEYVEDSRVGFASLALPAHLTWIVGAWALSAFHARLPSFRARRRTEARK